LIAPADDCPMNARQRFIARTLDLVIATPLLILSLPVQLVLAIVVRATSPGPAIYRAQRIGRGQKPFTMYKFRSMQNAPSGSDVKVVGKSDPRITPVGQFLRKSKLDELPQLLNVVLGSMSMVGPRPQSAEYVSHYPPFAMVTLSVPPGIAGPATMVNQEKLLTGSTPEENERMYLEELLPKRLQIDVDFVNNWTVGVYLKVLWRTLTAMFARSHARTSAPLAN